MHTLLWRPLIWVRMTALRSDVQPLGTLTYSPMKTKYYFPYREQWEFFEMTCTPWSQHKEGTRGSEMLLWPHLLPSPHASASSHLLRVTERILLFVITHDFCVMNLETDLSEIPRNWGADWRYKQALHFHGHLPASTPLPSSSVNTATGRLVLCRLRKGYRASPETHAP